MPELRRDPLTGDWVIYSESRRGRPEDFEVTSSPQDPIEECPFEPGREDQTPSEVDAIRPGGGGRSEWVVRVVPNKFPALSAPDGSADPPRKPPPEDPGTRPGRGAHEVVVETPHHEREWHRLSPRHMERVLEMYRRRVQTLGARPSARVVQVFKNRGGRAGATLSHPHAQVLTLPVLPPRTERLLRGGRDHHQTTANCYWCETMRTEDRRVAETDDFTAWCPRASRFPYQVRIAPKRHDPAFTDLTTAQREDLSHLLVDLAGRLEEVLRSPPYNVVLHTAPRSKRDGFPGEDVGDYFHWSLEYLPRVSRTAGLELATGTHLNHTLPETAARHLRDRGD